MQVIQWVQQAGQPHITKPVGRDLQATQEQLSQLQSKSEAVKVGDIKPCYYSMCVVSE